MEEVRMRVLREINLDENLLPIEGKSIFNSVFLQCDTLEVFLGNVDTKEELKEITDPDGFMEIYEEYLTTRERNVFNKAFERTNWTYVFNGKKYKINK